MAEDRLNQVLAIEKEVKARTYALVTKMHQGNSKPDLFGGFSKTYRSRAEDGEQFPPENKRVQVLVSQMLRLAAAKITELFDITAQKDWANCLAKGTVTVDGTDLLTEVPATYLLFLEKQLTDLRTFVSELPVLDNAKDWTLDENSGEYKTAPQETHRTQKIQKPVVLYDATPEHPAQTQLITSDEVIGHWDSVYHSGAVPETRRLEILERVGKLMKAVKFARESANTVQATKVRTGEIVFGYLFK